MSNPTGLEVAGIKYIIDDSEVAAATSRIKARWNEIGQAAQQATGQAATGTDAQAAAATQRATQAVQQHANAHRSLGHELDISHRSAHLFIADLASMTGTGHEATGAIVGLLAAAGPLDFVLVGIGAALAIASKQWEEYNQKQHEAALQMAGATRDFGQFTSERNQLLLGSNLAEMVKDFGTLSVTGKDAYTVWLEYQKALADAATADYVAGAAARTHAQEIQNQIRDMSNAGASIDALIVKYDELAKAQQLGGTGATAGLSALARAAANNPLPMLGKATAGGAAGTDFVALTRQFNASVMDSQRRLSEDLQSATEDRNARLADIEEAGASRRADIIASYGERIAQIDEQLGQARADAYQNLLERLADAEANAADQRARIAANAAQRIADAESNANDRRTQLAQDYADQRAQIEQNYQDRIRQIEQQYGDSLFDAEVRRDAKAIISAQRTRDQQLHDAAQQRDRENQNAQKNYEKQQADLQKQLDKEKAQIRQDADRQLRDLQDNLQKQQDQLRRDYERRIADLEQNAQRERNSAAQSRDKELTALNTSLAQQRAAEDRHYQEQKNKLIQANQDRLAELVKGLSEQKGVTEDFARQLVQSLSKILDPQQVKDLLKIYTDALNAKITVTVTPLNPQTNSGPPKSAQSGAYTGDYGGLYQLHPREVVLPLDNMARTAELTSRYILPRLGGAGAYGGGALQVHLFLDNDLLTAKVVSVAGHVSAAHIHRVTRALHEHYQHE